LVPKGHVRSSLADPALAARFLNVGHDGLLAERRAGQGAAPGGTLLEALIEPLATGRPWKALPQKCLQGF